MLLFRFTYVLTKHVQIVFWDLNKCLFIISSTRSEYEFTRQARFLCLKVQEKSSNKFSSNIRVRDITSVKLCWHEKFAPTFWLVRLQHPSKNLPSFGNKAFIFFEEFQLISLLANRWRKTTTRLSYDVVACCFIQQSVRQGTPFKTVNTYT